MSKNDPEVKVDIIRMYNVTPRLPFFNGTFKPEHLTKDELLTLKKSVEQFLKAINEVLQK